jgi:hypothetical protein
MTEQKTTPAINSNGGEPGYRPDWKERIQTMLPEQAASAAIAAGSKVLQETIAELHPDEREPVWRWGGLEDLLAPFKPVEYIVSGMIPKGSMTLLFGADGSLKSMLAMDLAVCVATGKEYLVGLDDQANGFATKEATVLWYDADNGRHVAK